MNATVPIRILLAEDVATDAELELRELKRAGLRIDSRVVDTEENFRRELGEFAPEVIVSDFSMPQFDGMLALQIARELAPETPFIFVSGTIGEEYAIRALKNGASDYVLKTNLMRLPPAVERAIQDRGAQARQRHIERLRDVEHAVTRALADAEDLSAALAGAIRVVCGHGGWEHGFYCSFGEPGGLLRVAETWSVPESGVRGASAPARGVTFSPGEGMAGRIFSSGQPNWSSGPDPQGGAFGFPVVSGGKPIGVLVFDGRRAQEPDVLLLETARVIGSQVGQFITRLRIAEEQRRFRVALDTSGDMIALIDRDSMRYVDVNRTICRLLGYTREEMLSMGPQDIVTAGQEDLDQGYDALIANPADSAVSRLNSHYRCHDGALLPFESTRHVVRSGDSHIIVSIARDIRSRIAAEEALRNSNERFNLAMRATNDVIWDWDLASGDFLWNENMARAFGHLPGGFGAGIQSWYDLIHPDDHERVIAALHGMLAREGDAWSDEYRLRRRDGGYAFVYDRGHVIRNADGAAVRMIGAKVDITARKEAEARLSYLAQFDTLSGLPNRHLFLDRLTQTLVQAQRGNWPVGVALVDLDRFKLVNDSLGHAVGDRLLKEVAARLVACVRSGDTVGRFSADEFGVTLSNLGQAADSSGVAEKILEALAIPFSIDGHEAYVTASVGLTLYPADGEEADALIANAYAAMYRAKEEGRNNYQFFTVEMNDRARRRVRTEAAMRRAQDRREFLLHFQPKIELAGGTICGFEALLRWKHPELGLVSPLEFIPVLEDTGLIVPVGEWVIEQSCLQIAAWQAAGIAPQPIAVNLSARQFQEEGLHKSVLRILGESGVDAGFIQFEITESLLMRDPTRAAETLRALRDSGFKVSVDDFGTGYSSLAYLRRFPLDALKIDRAFVREVDANSDDAAIAHAIIGMAHSLKLKVVAEGVETLAQLQSLRDRGCDEMQGFYFSRPLPSAECTQALADGRRLNF